MFQGGSFAQAHGRAPEDGPAWRFAFIATLISVVLLSLAYFVLSAAYPGFITTLLTEIGLSILGPTLLTIAVVVILLVNRFSLTYYARIVLKAAAKRGGRT